MTSGIALSVYELVKSIRHQIYHVVWDKALDHNMDH